MTDEQKKASPAPKRPAQEIYRPPGTRAGSHGHDTNNNSTVNCHRLDTQIRLLQPTPPPVHHGKQNKTPSKAAGAQKPPAKENKSQQRPPASAQPPKHSKQKSRDDTAKNKQTQRPKTNKIAPHEKALTQVRRSKSRDSAIPHASAPNQRTTATPPTQRRRKSMSPPRPGVQITTKLSAAATPFVPAALRLVQSTSPPQPPSQPLVNGTTTAVPKTQPAPQVSLSRKCKAFKSTVGDCGKSADEDGMARGKEVITEIRRHAFDAIPRR